MVLNRLKAALFAVGFTALFTATSVYSCDDRVAGSCAPAPIIDNGETVQADPQPQAAQRPSHRSYRRSHARWRSVRYVRRLDRHRQYRTASRAGARRMAAAADTNTGAEPNDMQLQPEPRNEEPTTSAPAPDIEDVASVSNLPASGTLESAAPPPQAAETAMRFAAPEAVSPAIAVQQAAAAPLRVETEESAMPPPTDRSEMTFLRAMFLALGSVLALATALRLALW